jgi:transposase
MLELRSRGVGVREIARAVGVSPDTASVHLRRAEAAGVEWPLPDGMGDADLARLLGPPQAPAREERFVMPDFAKVWADKRSHKGMTLQTLHERHVDEVGVEHAYSYNRYRELYKQWVGRIEPTMRQEHPPGMRAFVDYAGSTVAIIDPKSGEVSQAQVFVGSLGMSNLVFCEATQTQQLHEVCASHVRMFEAFGCVPEIVVPDNMKTAVTESHRYEPRINPVYDDLARHYGVAVVPARAVKPRDKAKVETSVGIVTRDVLAKLSGRRFFSVAEFNAAAAPLVDAINTRTMKHVGVSRRELFERHERPVMRPLPEQRWERCEWGRYKVPPSYHVTFDRHRYSVPYRHIGTQVDVRATRNTVEILTSDTRIASHPRSYVAGAYTTVPEHMPSTHRAQAEWTPERVLGWARKIGPSVAAYTERLLGAYRHPEQGFNAALGLTRLAKRWGDEAVDAACKRGLASGCDTYRSIESILKRGCVRFFVSDVT